MTEKLDFFPLCNQEGAMVNLNSEMMHQMSETSEPLTKNQFEEILAQHKLFIESGGRGGNWQSLVVAGLTFALYSGANASQGKQASFLNNNLSELTFNCLNLECCDFINIYCPNGRFENSNLSNSILIDSMLMIADFSGANLSNCDFSRAKMTNCRFVDANLSGCDFENCDLSFSNFMGANTSGARFPGAILDNVLF
jgi:uncharacterized protein YjbI with pentapeptide repeats